MRLSRIVSVVAAGLLAASAFAQTEDPVWDGLLRRFAVLSKQDRYAEALTVAEGTLRYADAHFGPDDLRVADLLELMITFYLKTDQAARAETAAQRALAIRERVLGPAHADVARTLIMQARISLTLGQHEQAEAYAKRSRAILEGLSGSGGAGTADTMLWLADLEIALNRRNTAEELYRQALAMQERTLGPEHPKVASTLMLLVKIFVADGRQAEAEPLYQRAVRIFGNALGPDQVRLTKTLSRTFGSDGVTLPVVHPYSARQTTLLQMAEFLKARAEIYAILGRHREAQALFQQALRAHERALGPDDKQLTAVLESYAAFLRKRGQSKDAKAMEARLHALQARPRPARDDRRGGRAVPATR